MKAFERGLTVNNCNCDRFEYLVGAATRAYSDDFLQRTGKDEATGDVFYRCRVCGTPWKRVDEKSGKTPRLVKLSRSANV